MLLASPVLWIAQAGSHLGPGCVFDEETRVFAAAQAGDGSVEAWRVNDRRFDHC
jgi:hypothetical protein